MAVNESIHHSRLWCPGCWVSPKTAQPNLRSFPVLACVKARQDQNERKAGPALHHNRSRLIYDSWTVALRSGAPPQLLPPKTEQPEAEQQGARFGDGDLDAIEIYSIKRCPR